MNLEKEGKVVHKMFNDTDSLHDVEIDIHDTMPSTHGPQIPYTILTPLHSYNETDS